ncbi:hypothetical protein ACLEIY_08960 [Acetobacter tropicalis]|uniref:Uncharacterized protein n=1 Tax=Acetobacter tropicalis NBRC 101654 TaxID=749388 RepID=F7VIV7_9PROT|nr:MULTISPECIES: hypothetical protein [Acetobacter]MCG4253174.1 hypothetical protein [Acetobacter senegalensis]GAA10302.1 hypothetical protein ATPR_3306 [Acetobacter tropicalis NBRC 101654]
MNAISQQPKEQDHISRAQDHMRLADILFLEADRFERFRCASLASDKLEDAAEWKHLAAACRVSAEARVRRADKLTGARP